MHVCLCLPSWNMHNPVTVPLGQSIPEILTFCWIFKLMVFSKKGFTANIMGLYLVFLVPMKYQPILSVGTILTDIYPKTPKPWIILSASSDIGPLTTVQSSLRDTLWSSVGLIGIWDLKVWYCLEVRYFRYQYFDMMSYDNLISNINASIILILLYQYRF